MFFDLFRRFVMKKLIVFFVSAMMALSQVPLQADVIVDLSDVVVSAGSTAIVTASIADTGASPAELSAYQITLDIDTAAGFSFAGLRAITGATTALTVFDPQESFSGADPNYDFLVNGSGGTLQLSATPIDLFQIEFSVDASAEPGAFLPVSFVPDPTVAGGVVAQPEFFSFLLDGASVNGADLPGLVVNQGSITVVGIPEPSLAGILLAAGGLVCSRRRR